MVSQKPTLLVYSGTSQLPQQETTSPSWCQPASQHQAPGELLAHPSAGQFHDHSGSSGSKLPVGPYKPRFQVDTYELTLPAYSSTRPKLHSSSQRFRFLAHPTTRPASMDPGTHSTLGSYQPPQYPEVINNPYGPGSQFTQVWGQYLWLQSPGWLLWNKAPYLFQYKTGPRGPVARLTTVVQGAGWLLWTQDLVLPT